MGVLRLLERAARVARRILGRGRVEVHPGKAGIPGRVDVGLERFDEPANRAPPGGRPDAVRVDPLEGLGSSTCLRIVAIIAARPAGSRRSAALQPSAQP